MYYFAYGLNLNKKQMQQQCLDSKPRLKATLPNYIIVFSGWSRKWRGGVATIKRSQGSKVMGAVYEVSDRDLRLLDNYEGSAYQRLNVIVFGEVNNPLEAITYIKVGQLDVTQPSKEYLALLQQAYRDWGIGTG